MTKANVINNKSKGGAVSIQVVFLMLVLVTMGAFAIVSARVNYNFSLKALEWNRMYYALEDMAEQFVMFVDGLIEKAETADEFETAAGEGLRQLNAAYPECVVMPDGDIMYAEINFTSETNEHAHLKVVLEIGGAKRYAVREWVQWQSLPDGMGFDLWDGTF